MSTGADRLKATVRRLRFAGGVGGSPPTNTQDGGRSPDRPPLRPEPTSAFEVAIAQRLKDLEEEIDRMRAQLNWLFLFIVAAALTNVVVSILK
jgi:hypothetical protein